MTVPSFVNLGTLTTISSVATRTPPLPGSRVNNNMLIAYIYTSTNTGFSVGGGWTLGDSINTGDLTAAWYWRLVDGTEAAPVFTWTGNRTGACRVRQYTGNITVTPFGATNRQQGQSALTNNTTLTTTADNSLIIEMIFTDVGQTIPLPTDFTTEENSSTSGGQRVCSGPAYNSGSVTNEIAVAVTPATTIWYIFSIELLGTGSSAVTTTVRASQIVVETLRTVAAITPKPKSRSFICS